MSSMISWLKCGFKMAMNDCCYCWFVRISFFFIETKVVFILSRSGLKWTVYSGAIALLVRFIWLSVSFAIWTLVLTQKRLKNPWKGGCWSTPKQTLVRFDWYMNPVKDSKTECSKKTECSSILAGSCHKSCVALYHNLNKYMVTIIVFIYWFN